LKVNSDMSSIVRNKKGSQSDLKNGVENAKKSCLKGF
jgi:hypothetical protein